MAATKSTLQPGPGRIRGVVRAQYLVLRRMVKEGKTTWEELEREGIVFPPLRESEFRRQVQQQLRIGKRQLNAKY